MISDMFRPAAVALFALAAPASAVTVGFGAVDDYDTAMMNGTWGLPYAESGFTVAPNGPWGIVASESRAGAAHLDDSGTDHASGLSFSNGSVFDVLGFTFVSLGFDFLDEPRKVVGNILLTGFLNGQQVVRDHVTMSPVSGTVQTVTLDAAFHGLDSFMIEILYPNAPNCGAPCGHIDLDEVVFAGLPPAPVPLPASGLLLGAAGLGLAAAARRRRRR